MKFLFTFLLLFGLTFCYGQHNFVWEKTDSVSLSKSKIYSLTKLYIAETWKSAQDVIQNDDKEEGVILLKGISVEIVPFMGGEYEYVYRYTVMFRMKERKCRIDLYDVYCESARMSSGADITLIQPFDGDNCPKTGTMSAPGLPKKKAIEMMKEFKSSLNHIVKDYSDYLKRTGDNSDW